VAKKKGGSLWGMLIMIALVIALLFYLRQHNVPIHLPNITNPH